MLSLKGALWLTLVIIHIAVIVRAVLLQGRDAYSRAAWLLLLLALPGIATILYLLFGEPWISTAFRRRSRDAYEMLLPYAPPADDGAAFPDIRNPFRTCEAAARWPVSVGNRARLAASADEAIDMIVADIDAATRTVHLSFYIWLADRNGLKVVDAVCRAAARGIVCRIVADAIGSRALIRSQHWRTMREAGAHLCASLPAPLGLGIVAGHRTDLRNHRKIAVIDGGTTWCGSQNCADAAFLPKRKFAPWVDILIRYQGPVARQAELIFASGWMAEMGEDMRPVFATDLPTPEPDGFAAIAVGTGPLSPRATMTDIFVALLAAARERVVVTTPYFAPDPPLLDAIVAAARRGVHLTIVFPRRNDSRIVGRSAKHIIHCSRGRGFTSTSFAVASCMPRRWSSMAAWRWSARRTWIAVVSISTLKTISSSNLPISVLTLASARTNGWRMRQRWMLAWSRHDRYRVNSSTTC